MEILIYFLKGYMVDESKAKGTMHAATRDKSPFIGNKFFFHMAIAPDSSKTAGEIDLVFGNEAVTVTK